MIRIEWAGRAFLQLERLPPLIAFEVIRRVDFLEKFPEIGARVHSRKKDPINYRQIYEYEPSSETVFILAVQHTRQRMPSMRDLKRE